MLDLTSLARLAEQHAHALAHPVAAVRIGECAVTWTPIR